MIIGGGDGESFESFDQINEVYLKTTRAECYPGIIEQPRQITNWENETSYLTFNDQTVSGIITIDLGKKAYIDTVYF